jgi:hypothetical protein
MARKPDNGRFVIEYVHGRGYLLTDTDPNVCKVYGPYETEGVAKVHCEKRSREAEATRKRKGER